MKNLKYYILFFIGILLLPSCLHEEEDIFGKSAAQRLNEAQLLYQKILTDAPNGWILEYMAGDANSNRKGAYNFLLKFENREVTASVDAMALDVIDPTSTEPYKTITSQFKLEQDMGVTLSFDTDNLFLHYFHEPHGSYTTLKGDFEFTIMEAYEDLIILRGKKYGNIMEMRRLATDVTWEDYLKDVNKITYDTDFYSKFDIQAEGLSIGEITRTTNNRFTLTLNDNKQSASNAIYTRDGLKFIDPLEANNKKLQNFRWDADTKTFINTDPELGSVVLIPILDPSFLYYDQFIGTYTLNYNLGTKDVTIEPKVQRASFTLKGLSDFDIELKFNKMEGTISMISQDVGISSDGYTVALCPWDTNAGYLTWSVGIGLVNKMNLTELEKGNIVFTFADNGVWISYKATGFLLRRFNSVLGGHSSSTYIGYYQGNYQFYNFTLTKK
ncbi:hypothetical protein M2451_002202 [Dysgonomonas sp. PFB1-18]|uniref:DUF4302 domain-containing protein n=1 Tax=unclassified Dysgonomonas TaxID=2630389 RepID=UPI002476A861|nr:MULTISPECIES: DUF4302 domain-containing protein [unclassified Dysgonomonas]MDL2302949.1 DUF4302 domain-containing protein [Dysgonomonas sp. OttesenSCG-928-D17]MDH6309831.1 hypothetical protein [Dysgonomonas sp. PF1-14]MDH6339375.1 hypothetical protein [Dysgonomonas sp. PF1-16]MDH6380874.1 hypothetical protein [Dysgonomonas sp. PFB1-18]MDH6397883.1 hypothetical protein [Dysgonomonas sp. PF1-23]